MTLRCNACGAQVTYAGAYVSDATCWHCKTTMVRILDDDGGEK